jgi:hypothetical protein
MIFMVVEDNNTIQFQMLYTKAFQQEHNQRSKHFFNTNTIRPQENIPPYYGDLNPLFQKR